LFDKNILNKSFANDHLLYDENGYKVHGNEIEDVIEKWGGDTLSVGSLQKHGVHSKKEIE
jgi:hypothetical protein